jgi:hypothetical protein
LVRVVDVGSCRLLGRDLFSHSSGSRAGSRRPVSGRLVFVADPTGVSWVFWLGPTTALEAEAKALYSWGSLRVGDGSPGSDSDKGQAQEHIHIRGHFEAVAG